MGRFWIALGIGLLGCAGMQAPTAAQQRVVVDAANDGGGGTAWIGGSPVRTELVVGSDGQTYVGVWIDVPDDVPSEGTRSPMDVSLVIDTSGSMSGEKIANARMAASSFLETLRDGDIVSIYGFNNSVTELAGPTWVSPETRPGLMRATQGLFAAGGTDMYDGLRVGISRLQQAPATHAVRRLVLISDGHANIGPSDPGTLGMLAANATEFGVQVTSIGVGLDYDERLLSSLAVRSSGRLHHLSDPSQMAAILEQELQLLSRTVATDALIEVVPAPGVTILDVETPGATVQNNRLRVPVGSIYAGQEREVLFRARMDTSRRGGRPLAEARLRFRRPGRAGRAEEQRATLRYDVTQNRRAAQASVVPRVSAMVASTEAARAQLRAAEALNRGDRMAATAELQRAERTLTRAANSVPAGAAPAVQQRLRRRARSVARGRRAAGAAATPAAARGAALEAQADAYHAQGY